MNLKTNTMRMNIKTSPWKWVPTVYFMEGIPFSIIVIVSTIMYQNLGVSNANITFYTGFLYLPWIVKPLWSWLVDIYRTKRWWIYMMELLVALAFTGVATSLYSSNFFLWSLVLFWLCAFFSSSHDIAADGFYLSELDSAEQSFFVGMQNLFYQGARLFASGLLVFISGYMITHLHFGVKSTWAMVLLLTAALTFILGSYHKGVLPKEEKAQALSVNEGMKEIINVIVQFFRLKGVWITILFVMTFRLGENQLIKISPLFMLDARAHGGLGFDNTYIGFANMFILGAMILAGVVGGITVYYFGLKKCMWYMVAMVNLPHLIYVYLAYVQPTNKIIVLIFLVVEYFATTFSLTAYRMITFMLVKDSMHKTAHYAFISAIAVAGIMLPSMFSGIIEQALGYKHFFIYVMLTMIPCLFVVPFIKIDPAFGKK